MNSLRLTIHSALLSAVAANTALAVTYQATLLNQFGGYYSGIAYGVSNNNTQVGSAGFSTIPSDAILWNAAARTATDLNPAGFDTSVATAVDGPTQVGRGFGPATGYHDHALLWHGTAASVVDLNPAGFIHSYAFGVSGSTQVGYATDPNMFSHAILWKGTAESAVDLSPDGFSSSYAWGASGNHQVGFGYPIGGSFSHALLWSGTAASAIDLQPEGLFTSVGQAVSGDSQVGYGASLATLRNHAFLWHSSAASAVDLHPAGFDTSSAAGVAGNTQVGSAHVTAPATDTMPAMDIYHAFLWHGTSASAVDLHQFLPATMIQSQATAVANNGSIVGYCQDNRTLYAVLWSPMPEASTGRGQPGQFALSSPIPEPSTLAMLYFGVFTAAIAGRKRCGRKLIR